MLRGAVERVDGHHVFALVVAGLNHFVVFLRNDGADFAAVAQGADEADVGNDVELLLVFALHVLAAVGAGDIDEAGAVDFAVHNFGGQGDIAQQLRQFAGGVGKIFLLAHDEAVEGSADGQGQFIVVHKWKRVANERAGIQAAKLLARSRSASR